MNVKIALGVVLALVVVGGGAYGVGRYMSPKTPPLESLPAALVVPTEPATTTPESTVTEGEGTLIYLLSMKGNLHCTFSREEAGNEIKGDVYVSGDRVRADIVAKIVALRNEKIEAHSVQRDNYAYGWTNAIPRGNKMKIPEGKSMADVVGRSGVNTTPVDYRCEKKTIADSIFTIPPGVQFVESSTIQ